MKTIRFRKLMNWIKFFNPIEGMLITGRGSENHILFCRTILILFILFSASMTGQDTVDPQIELESFHTADGFEVTLFAAEPMVVKPIQMNWDADGRLWVVSSTIYPHPETGEEANDKIYILEDIDGDGKADKSIIFAEGLLTPTGILPGDGGVYVANSTEILHLKDTDGDDKADQKRIVLSGFGTGDTHHLIHTFRWGPASRLYFNQSIYIYSHIETPLGLERLEGGGVWQLDPETLGLDIYAKGLINPWGLQFDRWGQSFLTDGAGSEGINYAFPGATFLTSPGAERILRGLNPGQPKHSGLEILSGRHLPESWQGSLITGDFRANRINRFELEEQGSGYVSNQVEDLLWSDDIVFRPVDMSVGPDGAIYVADWYNQIIQHGEKDFHDPRRDQEHGRIWRIVSKDRPLVKVPALKNATIVELLDALKLPEDWTRSQAKQVLKKRDASEVITMLKKWVDDLDEKDTEYEHHLLEALWVHQSLDVVNEQLLLNILNSDNHHARAAAIRTLKAWNKKIDNAPALLKKAVMDEHPQVRLEAVIALREIRTAEAARTALAALDYPMDKFLDFALWQTIRELQPMLIKRLKNEPNFLVDSKKTVFALKSMDDSDAIGQLVELYQKGYVPAEYRQDVFNSVSKWGKTADLNILLDIAVRGYAVEDEMVSAQLGALVEAARLRNMKPDRGLGRISTFLSSNDEAILTNSLRLIGYWCLEEMNGRLIDIIQRKDQDMMIRKVAMEALATLDEDIAKELLIKLLANEKNTAELRLLAIAQLVSLDVSEAARMAIELLRKLPQNEDTSELFKAFLSHDQGAHLLAKELMATKIPEDIAQAVRPTFERQIPWGQHENEDIKLLRKALESSGGNLPPERMPQQLSDREIERLALEVNRSNGNPELGEGVFRNINCVSCHAIGGAGGLMGPDLSSLGTSSPVNTIIESILFPSRSIKEGYELQRVIKKDGTQLMGYMVSDGSSEIVIRNMTGEAISIPKSEIEAVERVKGSLMPPGLTASLEREEFVNLVDYLSKLGESGKFRVPNEQYVRRWEAVSSNKEVSAKINNQGLEYLVNKNTELPLQSIYSKVSGGLPIEELPIIEAGTNKEYSFVSFDVEVLTAGRLDFLFNSIDGITAWAGEEQLELQNNEIVVNLERGRNKITLAIDRNLYEKDLLKVKLEDDAKSTAQARIVMGQ